MDGETFRRVLDDEVIVRDGKKYAWTIPISFPVEQALAGFSATPLGPHLSRLPPEGHRRIAEAAQREFRPLLHQGAVRGPMRSWVLTARA